MFDATGMELQKRYANTSTLPGTRSYHVLVSDDLGVISYKRTTRNNELPHDVGVISYKE